MASTTSLLKSAASRRAKIRAMQDAEVAFQWENSAQTYEDYKEYSSYLDNRVKSASDPSDQLSYLRKMRSARRSYTSNELQRQQMAIMEGRAGTQDKMDAVKELYDQAIDNGDYNLAQNLYSQWDSLSIKLQNEQEKAARTFAGAGKDAFKQLESQLKDGFDDVTLPSGQVVTPLAAISEYFSESGDTVETLRAAEETLEAIGAVVADRYQSGTITESEARSLEKKYGQGLRNLYKGLEINVGGSNLSYEDIVSSIANEQFNNPIYGLKAVRNEATGQTEFKLKANNVDRIDYVRQVDEQGQEYYVPATIRTDQSKLMFGSSDQGRGLNTQITDDGAVIGKDGKTKAGSETVDRDDSQSIRNRLQELGIDVSSDGTTLEIKLPGENVSRIATIEPDGSLRYFDDTGQIMELSLVDKEVGQQVDPATGQVVRLQQDAGVPRPISPEELSDFGSKSAFGGQLSQASFQGQRYVQDIMGQVQAQPTLPFNGPINTANNFGGYGTSVTSNLLQTAGAMRKANQIEQQRQAMLQAASTSNLNQTPIQQFTSSGIRKRQLQVAAPTPTPRLYVAPPPKIPKISSVDVARPTTRISGVAPLPTQPRVRVY